jgi:NAD(P)H-hydrate epimerase
MFPRYEGDIPYLSVAQMIEVDRAMMEDYQIDLPRMMENAGRNLAHLARGRFLDRDPRDRSVVVLAGSGGNGGGALVAARRLANWGASVRIALAVHSDAFAPVPAHQLAILRRMGIIGEEPEAGLPLSNADVVLDGLIGYSLRGAPRGRTRELIEWATAQKAPVLALDTPSGLDLTTGEVHDPTVVAAATMTLALPKAGLQGAHARSHVGELYLADISVPPSLYAEARLDLTVAPIFAEAEVIRLA